MVGILNHFEASEYIRYIRHDATLNLALGFFLGMRHSTEWRGHDLNALTSDTDLFNAESSLPQARRDEMVALVQVYKA